MATDLAVSHALGRQGAQFAAGPGRLSRMGLFRAGQVVWFWEDRDGRGQDIEIVVNVAASSVMVFDIMVVSRRIDGEVVDLILDRTSESVPAAIGRSLEGICRGGHPMG